nr:putative ribonuclease H-like domain-containing protein [Tanacetum cinerariifolium]
MVSSVKLHIRKNGQYILWTMKMEQYLAHTDYDLWEVILNGNSAVQMTKDEAEQFKVYVADIKGSSRSSSNSQNVAFVSSESTSSTNELSVAYSVSTAIGHSPHVQEEEATDFALMAFTSNPSSSSSLNYEFNEKEVLVVKEEEVTETVFDNHSSDEENSLVNDRFKKDKMAKKYVLPNNVGKGTSHKECRPVWNTVQRINHQKKFAPTAVFTRFRRILVNAAKPKVTASTSAAKPVNTAGSKQSVHFSKSRSTFYKSHSPIRRYFYNVPTHSRRISTERVNTAGLKAVSVVKGNEVTAVKTSTEFKNKDLDEFCRMKGIKREYSNVRTPQQNRFAETKNMTLIEATRTMLADSLLPITFWSEAVNNACYVLNRALVTKSQNKTSYELLSGRTTRLDFMKPFGCPVTILNTLDPLGKFDGKAVEGFLVGYSVTSKAFRVFNTKTRKVKENLHVRFLENKPNVAGTGSNWLFNIDFLTNSMNYIPVYAGNQTDKNAGPQDTNGNADTQDNVDAGKEVSDQHYIMFPLWSSISSTFKSLDDKAADDKPKDDIGSKTVKEPVNKEDLAYINEVDKLMSHEKEASDAADSLRKESKQGCMDQKGATKAGNTNPVNTVSNLVNAASTSRILVLVDHHLLILIHSFPLTPYYMLIKMILK